MHAGEAVAKRRRLPSSKGFDFFVESSYVELYNETCRDLYSKSGPAGAPNLPVSVPGWQPATLSCQAAPTGTDLSHCTCACHCIAIRAGCTQSNHTLLTLAVTGHLHAELLSSSGHTAFYSSCTVLPLWGCQSNVAGSG